jgi:acyl carrier protein
MVYREIITNAAYCAIEEINEELAPDQQLAKSTDTPLYGAKGSLDSLGLVRLIVTMEQLVEEELGCAITLADDRAFSETRSPFSTVGALIEYTLSQVNAQADE